MMVDLEHNRVGRITSASLLRDLLGLELEGLLTQTRSELEWIR